jgi:hypothetical protein
MHFTYRNPARSTDPERILPGARALVVGALRLPAGRPARPRAGRPVGWPATPGRPLRRAAGGARRGGRPPRPATGGGPGWWPTTTPSSTGPPPPGRARVVRQERQPPAPRDGLAGSCWAPCHRRPAPARPPVARRVRPVHPLPRRLPHGRHRRARRGRRPPVPGLAGAGPGADPPASTARPRRPPLRVRRLPGGVPAQPAGRPAAPRCRRRRRRRGVGAARRLLEADDADLLARHGRWYIARREPRTCAATRSSPSATSPTRPTRVVGAVARYRPHDPDPVLRSPRHLGGRRLGRDDLLAARADTDPPVADEWPRSGPAPDAPAVRHTDAR